MQFIKLLRKRCWVIVVNFCQLYTRTSANTSAALQTWLYTQTRAFHVPDDEKFFFNGSGRVCQAPTNFLWCCAWPHLAQLLTRAFFPCLTWWRSRRKTSEWQKPPHMMGTRRFKAKESAEIDQTVTVNHAIRCKLAQTDFFIVCLQSAKGNDGNDEHGNTRTAKKSSEKQPFPRQIGGTSVLNEFARTNLIHAVPV